MFDDRRVTGDRRKYHDPDSIPSEGCRRAGDRRDLFRQYEPLPWWLQTNYAEEMQPPLLQGDAVPCPKRRHGVPRPAIKLWDIPHRRRR
jgi:hypothetical protein